MQATAILGVTGREPPVVAAQRALAAWQQQSLLPQGMWTRNAAYWSAVDVVCAASPNQNARAVVER